MQNTEIQNTEHASSEYDEQSSLDFLELQNTLISTPDSIERNENDKYNNKIQPKKRKFPIKMICVTNMLILSTFVYILCKNSSICAIVM
jgi:hypothetical protein